MGDFVRVIKTFPDLTKVCGLKEIIREFASIPSAMPIVTASLLQRSKGETVINMHWWSGVTKVTLQTYIVNKQLDGAVVPLLSITRVSYIQDFIMSGTLVVSHINPVLQEGVTT